MVLHLVMHVMENGGMSITLLKNELMHNHDANHLEPHSAEEMTWIECKLVIFG